MKRFARASALVTIATLSLVGCESEEDDDPVAPVVASTGVIAGLVDVIDSTNSRHFESGVSVRLEATDRETVSDARGRWHLDSVEAGVYTIILSKPGYTTEYYFSFQFVGRDTALVWPRNAISPTSFTLYTLPTHRVSKLDAAAIPATPGEEAAVRFIAEVSPKVAYKSVTILLGSSTTMSKERGSYQCAFSSSTGPSGSFAYTLPSSILRNCGFESGATIYAIAYPGGATAFDWRNDRTYYMDLSDFPSQVISIVAP
jgi:hypothetical protein